ncbi:MAG: RloB domain-containing protein [Desulfitobacteriaceae bacterium]|nr:RloB domain-containing protein [Desulfitobacteriaceae bacterium]MDD4346283.1 RloB domain-containing protein [Desulfitobacteriaceae bacterium]
MKEDRKYYFTVEGETERWYLQWLQGVINAEPSSKYRRIYIDCPIQKDPMKRAKSLITLGRVEITHMFDYESNEEMHTTQFRTTLDRMKQAQASGKSIKYQLGHSNLTFELWMLLHKIECYGHLNHRRYYLGFINKAYKEDFKNLDQYKQENNFKRVLNKLNLDNVRMAIRCSKAIMQMNQENGFVLQQYKGYRYYKENPSLSIGGAIEKILRDCGLSY